MNVPQPPLPPGPQGPQRPQNQPAAWSGPLDVQRRERPGLGLGLAAVGSVAMLVGVFLPWAQVWLQVPFGERNDERTAGIFSLVDVVEDVTDGARRAPSGGALPDLFFPVLAVVLTVLCCLVGLLAGFGLRRRGLTNALRSVGTLLVGGTGLVALAALHQLGAGISTDYESVRVRPPGEDEPGRADMVSQVITHYGFWVWLGGAALLALATVIGPRVRHQLPDGTKVSHPSLAYGAPAYGAPAYGAPGYGAPAYGQPGTPMPPQALPLATQAVAAVLGGVAALLCLAGCVFLPWGEDTTFGDISGVVRDHGLDGHPVAGAYFGWGGWLLVLGVLVCAVLLSLGRRPWRFNAAGVRTPMVVGTVVATLFHFVALVDGDVFAHLDTGSIAVTAGLVLAVIGSLVPLRPLAPVHHPPLGLGPR